MQVAYKGAIELGEATLEGVQAQFDLLITAHEKNNISLEEAPKGGGNYGRPAPRPAGPVKEISGTLFFAENGDKWFDFRDAKAANKEKPNFPDFKSEDMKTSVWLYDQEGSPNEAAVALLKAAELTAAF
jgi:hypothetical protein